MEIPTGFYWVVFSSSSSALQLYLFPWFFLVELKNDELFLYFG